MTSAQIAIMTTIILYLCLVIFTGVMIGKRSKKSAEGFYLGGRGMGIVYDDAGLARYVAEAI